VPTVTAPTIVEGPEMTITALPARNIGVPGETSGGDDMGRRVVLRASDIAQLWGEERARARAHAAGLDAAATAAAVAAAEPVKDRTVYRYLQQSKTGMYRTNPMPMPDYPDERPKRGQIPIWVPDEGETVADLERRVRDWWHSRAGAGVGGGRPRKVPAQTVPCPCGCGERVSPGTRCDRSVSSGRRRPVRR
jgi:hypothetical protein